MIAGKVQAVPSPFPAFSRSFGGGFREGEVSILAGGPGSGKSHFVYQHLIHCYRKNIACAYMPLEDEKVDHVQRITAHLASDWKLLTADPDEMSIASEKLSPDILRDASEISHSVEDNFAFKVDANNKLFQVDSEFVLKWVLKKGGEGCRLIIIDPVSNITFSKPYKKEHDVQREFMQELIARVKTIPSHVVLVCHLGKGEQGSAGNVAGSAAFTRNAHNDLRIMHHQTVTSRVACGMDESNEMHNRTMYIAKARNGLPHTSIAFDVGCNNPSMRELGVIIPETKPNGRR